MRNEPVPQQELELVKNYLIGSFQRSIDGPFALADKFKSVLTYGLDNNYFYDYLKVINLITPADILNLADVYLVEETLSEIVVG